MSIGRASVLLVDDRRENLLALEAILDPLGLVQVAVTSGTEALKARVAENPEPRPASANRDLALSRFSL